MKIFVWIMPILIFSFSGCLESTDDEEVITSLSYRGHEQDSDINNFVNAYPKQVGTRLDDCILCHTQGTDTSSSGKIMTLNACDYCHSLKAAGESYSASLNAFGNAYLDAGRSKTAFGKIKDKDSDGDGYDNLEEISKTFFPGNENSNPSKAAAPYVEVSLEDIKDLNSHEQFMLSNSHKQQYDDYATYKGVRISKLLESQGISIDEIEGVTVFAPDGYAKSYTQEQVIMEYPAGNYFTGLDDAGLGSGNGLVMYPDTMAHNLSDRETIPDNLYLLLAYERDFTPLSMSYIDSIEYRIQGEGPFRSVRPQMEPSRPDRGSQSAVLGDGYDYVDSLDHNAGDNVRGVTVIRVDPMPTQYEEFDAMNASWRFLEQKKMVIYGYGIQ